MVRKRESSISGRRVRELLDASSWAMGRRSQPRRQCPRSDREPDVLKPALERLSRKCWPNPFPARPARVSGM